MIDKPCQKKKVQIRCIYFKDEKICVFIYNTSFTLHRCDDLKSKISSFYRKCIIIN